MSEVPHQLTQICALQKTSACSLVNKSTSRLCKETKYHFLNADFEKSKTKYLKWECSPDSKTVCNDIKIKWEHLNEEILLQKNKEVKVSMQKFVKEGTGEISEKTGKETVKIVPKYEKLNLSEIISFTDKLLVDIIHHRNQLKHFCTAIPRINASFVNALYIDIGCQRT